ncbi:hypothetical protein [Nitratireductor luteus]|uniref:hypothetical protein n=1 Tax=Nitratireductor luteus TaxID=2976980 RepID=UPI00224074E4|nr:hypothetical protein [Nitratireductor luteus]
MAGALLLALSAAGCTPEPMGGPLALTVEAETPTIALQHINEKGARCWMRTRDRAFRDLRLVPELDTAGSPRLLLVHAKRAQGLPVLVIEASGSPVKIETYGPLATTSTGGRVNADIMRWSGGSADCRS